LTSQRDLLWLNIRELPYFRGLMRAVEGRFYQNLPLESPTLDIGCGDGHFAQITFTRKIEIGVDPWFGPLQEARSRKVYELLLHSYGQNLPIPDESVASAVSNSVLEHIPDVQPVLNDISRVLKPGGIFYFCSPNHNFDNALSVARLLEKIGLRSLARAYRRLFDRISRHVHLDDPATWTARIEQAGMKVVRHWNYFSPKSLTRLEWGHYFGLPAWISKKLFGRWILTPTRWNLALTRKVIEPSWQEVQPRDDGVCTFFICQKVEKP